MTTTNHPNTGFCICVQWLSIIMTSHYLRKGKQNTNLYGLLHNKLISKRGEGESNYVSRTTNRMEKVIGNPCPIKGSFYSSPTSSLLI